MAQSANDLKIIHLRKLATPGKKYYGDDDEVYLGNSNGSLRLLDKAKVTTFKPTSELSSTNVQGALESISNNIKNREIEIDFGTSPYQTYKIFNIIDASILPTSKVIASKALKTPSNGRHIDEVFAETLDISAKANTGNFDLYIKSEVGTISGKFVISYSA